MDNLRYMVLIQFLTVLVPGTFFQDALTREQRKRLLHLLIHQITIGENRKIGSLQIKLNNKVLEEL